MNTQYSVITCRLHTISYRNSFHMDTMLKFFLLNMLGMRLECMLKQLHQEDNYPVKRFNISYIHLLLNL